MDSFHNFSVLLRGWFESQNIPTNLQRRLYDKLQGNIFDAGDSFSLAIVSNEDNDDEKDNTEEGEIDEAENVQEEVHPTADTAVDMTENESSDGVGYVLVSTRDLCALDDIWLVDHCCTFRLHEFRAHLETNDPLRERLGRIIALPLSHHQDDARAEAQSIFDHMWHFVGSYRLPASTQSNANMNSLTDAQYGNYWFIHDEVGSAIVTSSNARNVNMRLAPMPVLFPQLGGVLSVMWCTADMTAGTVAMRQATSILERLGTADETRRTAVDAWFRHTEQLEVIRMQNAKPNGVSGRRELPPPREGGDPLRVYTDSRLVATYLTDTEHFVLVEMPQEADILWITHDVITDFDAYPQAQFFSQFPHEHVFTSKIGLLHLVEKRLGYADWYQVSYNTTTQLLEFIGDYTVREVRLGKQRESSIVAQDYTTRLHNSDGTNLWITKPANMARSIDMTISSNLDELLRTFETGPKVVCKYIANTATLRRRKFDLRFIVALRSFTSHKTAMEAYVYDIFWARFALENYSLNDYDCYEKHWTVMNYANPEKMLQLHHDAFIQEFNTEYAAKGYGDSLWETVVYPKILTMLRDVFDIITLDTNQTRCRAIYGVDVMLRETISEESQVKTLEPSLLEITYSPDCQRACKYHPEFFNNIFNNLFLGCPINMTLL